MINDAVTEFILKELDDKFRPTGAIHAEWFPDHEFDSEEAGRLVDLCTRIRDEGYSFFIVEAENKEFHQVLNLAAEYGTFVKDAGAWYLGVFIAATLVMEPFAADSFCDPMLRGMVFRAADSSAQEAALFLMFLAIIAVRTETSGVRLDIFRDDLDECLGRDISTLNIDTALKYIGMGKTDMKLPQKRHSV